MSLGKGGDQSGAASRLPPRRMEADRAPGHDQERGGLSSPVLASQYPRWHQGGTCHAAQPPMLNHSPNNALSRTQTQLVRQPQRGDPRKREQRREPVPRDDPSRASARQVANGRSPTRARRRSREAGTSANSRPAAGGVAALQTGRAREVMPDEYQFDSTFPGARLARGTAANELCSPASGAVPACLAQLACQGMTEMTSGPSYVLPGSIATTTANSYWDI